MKLRKALSLLLLLSLLLTLAACAPSGTGDTTPSTDPINTTAPPETTLPPETTAPTEPPVATTVPTEPEETEPVGTEPQLQFRDREPGAVPMTENQLQFFHWQLARDSQRWYEVILCSRFSDPKEINFYEIFSNGIPSEPPADLTYWEIAFLTQTCGTDPTHFDVDRISREKVLEVLCTYYMLTPEEAAEVDLGDMIYNSYTDSYYSLENGAYGGIPVFFEGYMPDEQTKVIYYGFSGDAPTSRAVFWTDPETRQLKVLEITKVDP